MHRRLTVLMYHYVRRLKGSRFAGIKGLETDLFRGQLGFLKKHYQPVTMSQILCALNDPKASLPPMAVTLTFDDGFKEHLTNVVPILEEYGFQGCFYPPVRPIEKGEVLDVHKIHHVLAVCPDTPKLIGEVFALLDRERETHALESNEAYYEKLAQPGRRDGPEIVFVKRLLQMALPEAVRRSVVGELFRKHVTADEKAFSAELYLNAAELRQMRERGMHVGSHGYGHYWMDTLSPEAQEKDVLAALDFLRREKLTDPEWSMCYPYGKFNLDLHATLKKHGCAVAFVDYGGIADLDTQAPYKLARLATNEIPTDPNAAPGVWTEKARGYVIPSDPRA